LVQANDDDLPEWTKIVTSFNVANAFNVKIEGINLTPFGGRGREERLSRQARLIADSPEIPL